MAHTILSRSPYFVTTTHANLAFATIELWLYTGTQTTNRPTDATYTMQSTSIDTVATFEIGSLINDKLIQVLDGTYRADGVWVDYQVTQTYSNGTTSTASMEQHFALDGYSYFTDGANFDATQAYYHSTDYIRCFEGQDTQVAINRNYDDGGVEIASVKVKRGTGDIDVYSNSTTTASGQVVHYYDVAYHANNTSVKITFDDASSITMPIVYENECKYTPIKAKFINRWGAMEDLWFFKQSKLSSEFKREEYQNNNIQNAGTFNINEHQYKQYNITSKEQLEVNSGWVNERYNESFRQLLNSEQVWITYNGDEVPVSVDNNSFDYQTSLTEKLINYSLTFKFAYDNLNTVR